MFVPDTIALYTTLGVKNLISNLLLFVINSLIDGIFIENLEILECLGFLNFKVFKLLKELKKKKNFHNIFKIFTKITSN